MKSSHNLKLLDNITRKMNPHPTRENGEEENEIPSFLGYETCYSVEMNERKKIWLTGEYKKGQHSHRKELKQFNYDAFLGSTAAMLPAEMSFQRAMHIETRERRKKIRRLC